MRPLVLPTSPHSGNKTVEMAVGSVVDDPSAFLVLVNLVHLGVELCPGVKAVGLPDLSNLAEDLLAIRVASLPLNGRKESVHERMDLQA